ncbi:DUF3563 family protein [Paraburkholderia sp. J67]|uniref:DUF3563 family protein n=1 Tax=Paraburkholderia sp. J67 TaxID=2805435 RepID=UPI002ABDBABF|nr:DUF3563 family protein [Paraburkholderia sp. J67]
MFAKLISQLEAFFVIDENKQRDAWLASSADLAELERRSRYFDTNHTLFAPHGDRDGR